MLGDFGKGNGDPSLTVLGEKVTPNRRESARPRHREGRESLHRNRQNIPPLMRCSDSGVTSRLLRHRQISFRMPGRDHRREDFPEFVAEDA